MATTGAAARALLRWGAASSRHHLFRPISSSQSSLLALHKESSPAKNQQASGLSSSVGGDLGCGSLLLRCPDELGIIAGVSDCLLRHGSNIRTTDLHVEKDGDGTDTFVCRISYDNVDPSLESSIGDLVAHFGAHASLVLPGGKHVVLEGGTDGQPMRRRVLRESGLPRAGIFMSKTEHCLLALLNQVREGDLPLDIRYVVSNHPRDAESSHVQRSLLQLGVDYYHIPHGGRRREDWEADIKEVVGGQGNETDFLVLARYMQILPGSFLSWYGRSIINIHHGLLPSFKGANPYRQAHNAGVKLIGATAHFVTEDLDEGPIIEQRVARLSHKDNLNTLRIKSENLEAAALQDAVRYFAENRIAKVGGRTVVFS